MESEFREVSKRIASKFAELINTRLAGVFYFPIFEFAIVIIFCNRTKTINYQIYRR